MLSDLFFWVFLFIALIFVAMGWRAVRSWTALKNEPGLPYQDIE